jgi:heat shock protein HtpX
MSTGKQVLDFRRLRNSTVPTWLGLVTGSWVGILWGGIATAPVGVGLGVLGVGLTIGIVAVPLWGTAWGLIGLSRARESGIRANQVTVLDEDHPLTQITYRLCERMGMEARPMVGTMPAFNAYAIGSKPEKALVVVGEPLLERMSPLELAAIIGHELGHVANNDMRRMGLARSFQNALVWFMGTERIERVGRWLLTWLSELMILGMSRKREYWADAIGAALTSKQAMAGALEKIHAEDTPPLSSYERLHARMMFKGFTGGSLFSTHPTLAQRLHALEGEHYLRRLPLLTKPTGSPVATVEAASAPSPLPERSPAADLAY